MGSEDYEIFKVLKQERMHDGIERRSLNKTLYQTARQLAASAGLVLIQHTEVHYGLSNPTAGWLLNIYPGNRRLYADRGRPKPPFLRVKPDWNLMDVVHAAIAASNNMDAFAKEVEAKAKAITDEYIATRAYYLWEAAGRPPCDGQEFWHLAEQELRGK